MSRGPLFPLRIVLGVVAISFGAILVRLAGEAAPIAIATWRVGLAALVLLPIAIFRGGLRRIERKDLFLAIGSGLALAVHFILWISSLRYTSVASSVLFVTAHPIFVGLGSHFLLREPVDRRLIGGAALSLIGGVFIGWGDLKVGGTALYGDLLAIGGGLAAAVYFLLGRRARQRTPLIDYIAIAYGTAAATVLFGSVAARSPLTGFSQTTYLYLALLAVGPQLIGHTTFNWALKELSALKVSVVILAEPVGASLLALLFFGEIPGWLNGIGAVIILSGIYLSLKSEEGSDGNGDRSGEDRMG